MVGLARQKGATTLAIGGMPDHVHMLFTYPHTILVSKIMQHVKGVSSLWIKETFPDCGGFAWQEGFSGFSCDGSNPERLISYIENQREHHKNKTYTEELVYLLDRYGVEYDQRDVSD
jgi:REP element-mobilizing transposase RayT